ncbi:MAG TPA: hypothetical protein VEB22_12230 [Phycisphaerales bacterium]|nr:hypothetical protein [Phycisphaerales bacterium]
MPAVLLMLSLCAAGLAQDGYTFEMRLIPDGDVGSPGGPSAAHTYILGGTPLAGLPTRAGFWLQARVAQTSGQNWGITRASSPAGGGASFISVNDPAVGTSLSRGVVNSGGTLFGRGTGYRSGGANTGGSGNAPGSAPFPGGAGNENGGLDNGGAAPMVTRIYGFDAYLGPTRSDTDSDGDGDVDDTFDGLPEQPWRVNGGPSNAASDGQPHPSDGTFSAWANLYRFYVDFSDVTTLRDITINASALLNGAVQASPTSPGGATYALQLGPGQVLATTFTIRMWPTPGAAALLSLAAVAGLRRRR